MWKYDLVAPNLQTKATTPNPNPVTNAKRKTGYKRETRNAKPVATAKPETGDTLETRTQDALLQRVMWNRLQTGNPIPGAHSKPDFGYRILCKVKSETQDALLQRVMWKYDLVAPKPGDASKLMAQVRNPSTINFTKSRLLLLALQNHYQLYKILFSTSFFTQSLFTLQNLIFHCSLFKILLSVVHFTRSTTWWPRSSWPKSEIFPRNLCHYILHQILLTTICFTKSLFALQNPGFRYLLYKIPEARRRVQTHGPGPLFN